MDCPGDTRGWWDLRGMKERGSRVWRKKNLGMMVGSGPWGIGGMVFWEGGGKGL